MKTVAEILAEIDRIKRKIDVALEDVSYAVGRLDALKEPISQPSAECEHNFVQTPQGHPHRWICDKCWYVK